MLTQLLDAAHPALAPQVRNMQPPASPTSSSPTSSSPTSSSPASSPPPTAASPPPTLAGWQPHPLSPDLRRVCYFSHFDASGHVAPYTLHLLDSIILAGFRVLFITCSPWLTPVAQRQLQLRGVTCVILRDALEARAHNFCRRFMVRRNIGRDFGSWAVGFSEFPFQPDVGSCSSSSSSECDVAILLANDSVFGPLFPLAPAISQFFSSGADLFGLTESLEVRLIVLSLSRPLPSLSVPFFPLLSPRIRSSFSPIQAGRHLQSYFLLVSRRLWCVLLQPKRIIHHRSSSSFQLTLPLLRASIEWRDFWLVQLIHSARAFIIQRVLL
jgi:hypothetical protein